MNSVLAFPAVEVKRLQNHFSRPYGSCADQSWDERVQAVQEAKRWDPCLSARELAIICFEGEGFVLRALKAM